MASDWKFALEVPENPFSSPAKVIEWEELKKRLALGSIVSGRIFIQAHFGVFFDAGLGFPVLINVTDFGATGPLTFPDDYPALDSTISGAVWGLDDNNRQVRITTPANYAVISARGATT
jgi:transcriptional accessory protein Tex/SPT6